MSQEPEHYSTLLPQKERQAQTEVIERVTEYALRLWWAECARGLEEYISIDPAVMTGQPCVKGYRITAAQIVDNVVDIGLKVTCQHFKLTVRQVAAALMFAARCARLPYRVGE